MCCGAFSVYEIRMEVLCVVVLKGGRANMCESGCFCRGCGTIYWNNFVCVHLCTYVRVVGLLEYMR